MIRRYTRVGTRAEDVMEVFRDTDAWPRWMPTIASTRTLAEEEGRRLVEVVGLMFGRRLVQKLECRERGDTLIHRQVEGWFKKWEATWTFRSSAESGGTVVSLSLDFDLGVTGLLVPHRLLGNWVGSLIEGMLDQGRQRAERFARRRREPTRAVEVGQPLLQVFETADGYEIRFGGRTFHLEAPDLPDLQGPGER